MDLRLTDRAYADIETLRPAEYAGVATAMKAIRDTKRLPGARIAVANDQYDIYVYDLPEGGWVLIFVCDPAVPEIAALAGLWPEFGRSSSAWSSLEKSAYATGAASAIGLNVLRVHVF